MSNRTILHVDMNAFFAAVEQAANPALRGKPIAVGGGIGKATVVAACSYEAKALGIKNGMSAWEAKKICPALLVVIGDMSKYIYISKEMVDIFNDYTDLVEVFSIDEAFLDVTQTAERFEGPVKLASDIKKRIFERFNLTCTVGVGPNKLLAKLAGELKKPDGLIVLEYEDVPKVFDAIPVRELCGVGAKLEEYLGEMGVKTCGDLGRYPAWKLVKRFGPALGEHLHNMGRGKDDSPVVPCFREPPAKSMGHSYTLPRNTRDWDEIKSYLLQLSEQTGRRLRRHGYRGKVLSVYIRFGDLGGFSRQKDIVDFVDDGYEIYERALKMLEKVDLSGRSVRFVGVCLSSLIKDIDQISLIEKEEANKKVLKAMDEINDRFGEATVTRASLLRTELHEKVGMVSPRVYKKQISF